MSDMALSKPLLSVLACPKCKGPVDYDKKHLVCEKCKLQYSIKDGVPNMTIKEAKK